jgi:hypothetical protein
MVGSKTLRSFYATCGESVQPLQSVQNNRLAVLTVKSGLDPHMIIELEDGSKSLLCLAYAYGISYLSLYDNCGMVYTYTLLVIRC